MICPECHCSRFVTVSGVTVTDWACTSLVRLPDIHCMDCLLNPFFSPSFDGFIPTLPQWIWPIFLPECFATHFRSGDAFPSPGKSLDEVALWRPISQIRQFEVRSKVANLYCGIPVKTGKIDLPHYRYSTLIHVLASWPGNRALTCLKHFHVKIGWVNVSIKSLWVQLRIFPWNIT